MAKYVAVESPYSYRRPDGREHYWNVLTSDGGIIECKNQAAAERVAADMNALCERIDTLECACPSKLWPTESQQITAILNAWCG
jgi:hypothetical protein